MNWLKSLQKRPLVTLVALVVTLVATLMALASLEFLATLVATLIGSLVATLTRSLVASLEKNGPSLILPPGTRLRDVLHFIYPPKTVERIFDQTIADIQLEWQEAMINDKKWLARWVQVRGVLTIFLTMCVHAVATLGSIFKLVK